MRLGIADHLGWAVAVTAADDHRVADRRRIELVEPGLTQAPIHYESRVGAATWSAAVDHGYSIIFDLAMGGGYPDGVCGCKTPTDETTSGGTLTVRYVAAYTR